MSTDCTISAYVGDLYDHPSLYKSIVGALQCLTITRLDLFNVVNKVCQFMVKPLFSHWRAIKRILCYLKGTFTHGLVVRQSTQLSLQGFADSNQGGSYDDCCSTSGLGNYLDYNLISWSNKKQSTVSCSSIEVEYRALVNTTVELMQIESLLVEVHASLHGFPTIWCDNLSTQVFIANLICHARTKHVKLNLHFVRDRVFASKLLVLHIPSFRATCKCSYQITLYCSV